MFRKLAVGLLLICFAALSSVTQAQNMREAIASVQPKMVKIYGAGGLARLQAYSSGFLISPEGHIATVWSHVLDSDTVTVILDDGRKFEGKVLGAEPQLDLAVLKIPADDLPFVNLESQLPTGSPGMRVLAFSNVFKVATGNEPVSVMHGVISAKSKLTARRGAYEVPYDGPVYLVDAITNNSGAAGGLLTTRDGRPLAMLGKELRNSQSNTWINYAIPLSELSQAITEIKTGRFTSRSAEDKLTEDPDRPRRYAPLDFGLVLVPDVLVRTPAYVDSVTPDSEAAKQGVKPDDLVILVNDVLIQSCKSLNEELGKLEAGDLLRIVLRREGALVTIEMRVPVKAKKE